MSTTKDTAVDLPSDRPTTNWQPLADAAAAVLRTLESYMHARWFQALLAVAGLALVVGQDTVIRWVEALGYDGVLRIVGAFGAGLAAIGGVAVQVPQS